MDKNKTKILIKKKRQMHDGKQQCHMPYASMLYIPPTNYHLLAALQQPHTKCLT